MPGNYPEAPLTGKGYNINELVTYMEDVPLYYPKTKEEFNLLGRRELKFDEGRAGKQGCPLKYPSNADELELSGLGGDSQALIPSKVNEPLQKLIQPQQDIPFMFKMPVDEETFISKGFPGDYEELSKKYKAGEIVAEMDTYRVKKICQLKAVDDSETCYLVNLNEELPSVFKVKYRNIIETLK